MIKILFTIPNFITAGSGRALLNVVSRLDPTVFEPAICVERKGGKIEREIEELGIPLLESPFTVPARPYTTLIPRCRRLSLPFKDHRFTLWHSFHYLDDYTEPIIARLAGVKHWIFTKKNMNWHTRAWRVRSVLARRILAQNSDMMRQFFDTWLLRHKARQVPRGVDTEKFCPTTTGPQPIRTSLSIPPRAVVVGCVAHLVPVKGHTTLLQAAARTPEVTLFIAGKPLDKPYADKLHRMTRELGIESRVFFLGDVEDVSSLLQELDVFVLPSISRGEGCPVALLEAMAAGLPCVTSDVPGSRDVIEPGRSGLLAAAENVESLSQALTSLASSPSTRQDLGVAARQRIEKDYSIQTEVHRHETLYREVTGTR